MEENFAQIKLPNFVLANWFSNHLIDDDIHLPIAESKNLINQISFLGNNEKKIVIIVNEADGVHISDNNLILLEKLLAACKLNLNDVAIVNMAKQSIVYNELMKELQPQILLLLGINLTSIQLPLVFPMHKIQAYNNCKMLLSTSIERMQQTTKLEVVNEKKELWGLLKILFGL